MDKQFSRNYQALKSHDRRFDGRLFVGVSSRHLRRLFQDRMGISPNDFALNRRLLQAVQLITDTHLPLSEIALQSGFKSLRSFNHLFQQKYQQSPGSWRKPVKKSDQKTICLKLGYRPPYDWQAMLGFLSQRMIPDVEQIEDGEYRRTVRMESASGESITGWIVVSHLEESFQLQLQMSGSLALAMSDVLTRVRRLFDLDCDPEVINDRLGSLVENLGLFGNDAKLSLPSQTQSTKKR